MTRAPVRSSPVEADQPQDQLTAGLAARSTSKLTYEQAAERLAKGGERYREMLDHGRACVLEALTVMLEQAADNPDRWQAVTEAQEAVQRHEVPYWIVRPVMDHWADNYNTESTDSWNDPYPAGANRLAAAHWHRTAVYEYVWPGCQDYFLRLAS